MPRLFRAPSLRTGRVYRTTDLRRFSSNPTRLAERLVEAGEVQKLGHGLYYRPRRDSLGDAPPSDEEILRAFLKGTRYLLSGPERWNAFHLGTTALAAHPIVYNELRTGLLDVGGRRFQFRRVRFPKDDVTPEWFIVDMLNNRRMIDVPVEDVLVRLKRRIEERRLSKRRLRDAARRFGTRSTRKLLEESKLVEDVAHG